MPYAVVLGACGKIYSAKNEVPDWSLCLFNSYFITCNARIWKSLDHQIVWELIPKKLPHFNHDI